MTEFVLNEDSSDVVELPDTWMEVSYEKFQGFAKLISQFQEREGVAPKGEEEEWENTLSELQDNTKVLCYWCGISEERMSMVELDVANRLMNHLNFLNDAYVPITISSFSINNEKFFLPENFMQKSSFGRYIEAEQVEIQSNMLRSGKLEILPRQIAILCKKEGESEKLDDSLIDKRANLFKKLDMATIWDVGFFLGKLEQRLTISSLIFLEKEAILSLEQQLKKQ